MQVQTPFKRILPCLFSKVTHSFTNCIPRGKFSIQQFLRLKKLAANTVGVNNSIFDIALDSLLTLYKSLAKEIDTLETEINKLVEKVHDHYLIVPGIGSISAAVIYAEYGDISNLSNPEQMPAFAGIEPGISNSGTRLTFCPYKYIHLCSFKSN